MIGLRALPEGDLGVLVAEMLRPGVLLPVNIERLAFTDIHNVYRNADEHLLFSLAVSADAAGKGSLDKLFNVSRRVRQAAKMLLIWRRVPLAKAAVDRYRKAIAQDYPAMIEAGSVLVKLGDPELAVLYESSSTR